MKLIKLIGLCMLYASVTYAEIIDLRRLEHAERSLIETKYLTVQQRFRHLQNNNIPFPYPNMSMSYMTHEDSVYLFMSFLMNNWEDNFSFEENWWYSVKRYNKKHRSLPIRISP